MSFLTLNETVAPTTPAAAKMTTYTDKQGVLNYITDAGITGAVGQRSMFNWIRNSGFWFAQRQDPAALTTYSATAGRAFSADGWGITNENASAQYIRVDTSGAAGGFETGLQARFYGKFTKITSTGKLIMSQAIIGDDSLNLRGRVVRLTVRLKTIVAASATWRIGLVSNVQGSGTQDLLPATFISAFGANTVDPTVGTGLAYIAPPTQDGDNCTVSGNGASCAVTTAWQQFSMYVTVPTTCINLIAMIWSDSQVAATNGVSIGEVSVTDGLEIQAWSPMSYDNEFMRVQRFYQKTFDVDTKPVTAAGAATGALNAIAGKAGATALGAQLNWLLPVPLWAFAGIAPTTYNPVAANAAVRDIPAAVDTTATVATLQTRREIRVTATGAAGTAVGNQVSVHVSVDAEF